MAASAKKATVEEIQGFREQYRREMNCQIVHDSLHYRPGWTVSYVVSADGEPAGYGSVAIAGPWAGKPTIFELYVDPAWRHRAFELFDAFLAECEAGHFEVQSNEQILPIMLYTYGVDLATEAIVFAEGSTTNLVVKGAVLRALTDEKIVRDAISQRQGGGEWNLDVNGEIVATGGILFHYNTPYGDVYMDVKEPFRRRGYGSFLVQELKRVCRELASIPCARYNVSNVASRRTLQKAGFVPVAAILTGTVRPGMI